VIWHDGVVGGEVVEEVAARADRFLAGLAEDGDVLVFAHGHLLRILTARWLGLAPQCGQCFKLGPASLSILGWEYDAHAMELWNDTSHLA
jgi:probable phosphoglycerate mutase